jgi:hypothetical protein
VGGESFSGRTISDRIMGGTGIDEGETSGALELVASSGIPGALASMDFFENSNLNLGGGGTRGVANWNLP